MLSQSNFVMNFQFTGTRNVLAPSLWSACGTAWPCPRARRWQRWAAPSRRGTPGTWGAPPPQRVSANSTRSEEESVKYCANLYLSVILTFGVFFSIAFLIQIASASWASSFSLFLVSMIHLLSRLSPRASARRPRLSSAEARRPARPLQAEVITHYQDRMTVTLSSCWRSQTRPHKVWTFLFLRQTHGLWISSQYPYPWHYWALFYNRWRTDDLSGVLISPSFFEADLCLDQSRNEAALAGDQFHFQINFRDEVVHQISGKYFPN